MLQLHLHLCNNHLRLTNLFFSSKYATFWFGKFGSIAQKTKIKTETLSALYIFFAQMLPVETVLPFQMRRESNFQVLLSGIWQEMKNRRNRIMLIHCRGQHKAELVTIDSPAGSCLSCCYQVQWSSKLSQKSWWGQTTQLNKALFY